MSSINLEDLSLHEEEEEGFTFDIEEGESQVDFRWCLVGRFLSDRPIHVNSMKATMADVWRPVKGVKIKEAEKGLFLFQFSHELDMEAVLQGTPWSFDNRMLIVGRVQLGVQIENVPLYHVDFWVQVHNLPTGLMAEKVGRALANYIGSFVEYDKNNNSSFWRKYMRIRVRVDVRQPLKKDKKVKSAGGDWCTVNFKYEKLGIFCFVCGIMGHAENKCVVRFSMERDDGIRVWSNELRAESRRHSGRPTSRWLMEEEGGSGVTGRRNNSDHVFNASGPSAVPTYHNNQSMQFQNNIENSLANVSSESAIIIAPSVSASTASVPSNSVNPYHIAQLSNHSKSPDPQTSTLTVTQLWPNYNLAQSLISNNQPHNNIIPVDNTINNQSLTNYNPDKTIITQLPSNNNPVFSFQSPQLAHLDRKNNPLTRPIKSNPTHKLNRTSPNPNQLNPKNNPADPKINPVNPKPFLTQNPTDDMETQTEKKRRREEAKKETDGNSESIEHFLSAGPGSQACRDQ
jgi:14-3-3 protein epsilon